MNAVYDYVAKFLAKYLDKLKVKSPVVFLFVQGNLATLLSLFVNDSINIPSIPLLDQWAPWLAPDTLVIGILGALMILISPRTSVLAHQAELDAKKKEEIEE